MKKLIILFF